MCGSSCGCNSVTIGNAPAAVDTAGDVRTTYTVSGMTCGGCAKSVNRQVSTVAGVTGVEVDVATGTVTVSSTTPLEVSDVRAAVEQAGYQLVD